MEADTANLIVAISNLTIAAIVPFLSVFVAQRLIRRDAMQKEVTDAFLRVRRDAQLFRHAFLHRHPEVWTTLPHDERPRIHLALLNAAAELDADCLLIGLIFADSGNALGARIQAIADTAHILFEKPCLDGKVYPIPTYDICQTRLGKQITELCHEMRPLWDVLTQSGRWLGLKLPFAGRLAKRNTVRPSS